MLSRASFTVFEEPTLSGRLQRIRAEVDPDFETLGGLILQQMQPQVAAPLYLHVAKHLRRHKNPPVDTWLAISTYQRGYKMLPHFEVGLWADRLFVTLDLLADMQQRAARAEWLVAHQTQLAGLAVPQISTDHTSPNAQPLTTATLQAALDRYQQVKSGEFILGSWVLAADPRFTEPERIQQLILAQIQALTPLYRELMALD
ncbi:DUF1054 domain-containing protein [Lapidilactobacillus luobeiensis]|uniref:DUF1054 domain-containing protein n=1 Tax=Lapidilactobacillus luobeiensis TaxID=2950371 RepID=UPI0021C49873|nr:DUF1054 domain-containing protein [Lapidilactobacillus luobeiensis]